jgi:hypothetical protein
VSMKPSSGKWVLMGCKGLRRIHWVAIYWDFVCFSVFFCFPPLHIFFHFYFSLCYLLAFIWVLGGFIFWGYYLKWVSFHSALSYDGQCQGQGQGFS